MKPRSYSFTLTSEWSSTFEAIRSSSSHPLSTRNVIIDLIAAYLTLHPLREEQNQEEAEESEEQSSPSPRRKRKEPAELGSTLKEPCASPEELIDSLSPRKPSQPRKR